METIRGRRSHDLDLNGLQQQLAEYRHALIDLGTGDGRYVRSLAEKYTESFFIGIDACRENLRVHSQRKLPNTLFIIASAQALPDELNGLASHVSINFPWGSLLESLPGCQRAACPFKYLGQTPGLWTRSARGTFEVQEGNKTLRVYSAIRIALQMQVSCQRDMLLHRKDP